MGLEITNRPQSSSLLGVPYRILNMNPKKELLWGLWVGTRVKGLGFTALRVQLMRDYSRLQWTALNLGSVLGFRV